MSQAPYVEEIKETLDEYRGEMEYFDVELERSYHIEEKNWMGAKIRTSHDGVYVLLKVLRSHGFIPTQVNKPDEEQGLVIYIDEAKRVMPSEF